MDDRSGTPGYRRRDSCQARLRLRGLRFATPFSQLDDNLADPAVADPSTVADAHINDFDYQQNHPDGLHVPRAAHIRKVYPRDQEPPG